MSPFPFPPAVFPTMYLFCLEPIIISDSESEPSHQGSNGSGEETECELPPPNVAKRLRSVCSAGQELITLKYFHSAHSPDRTEGNTLSASVSSLCLGEAPPLSMPSTFALDAWAALRKASAPYVVDGTDGEPSFGF